MNKKAFILALALLLALTLCACGDAKPAASAPAESPEPVSTEAPTTEPALSEEQADLMPALPDAGLHAAEEKPADEAEISARLEQAKSFIGKDVQDLIRALGEPAERSYAPSCVGKGEDGELQYEGFTVYTYREGDRETVTDAA